MQVVTRKRNVWGKKNATSLNSQSKIIATIMVDYNEKYLYKSGISGTTYDYNF